VTYRIEKLDQLASFCQTQALRTFSGRGVPPNAGATVLWRWPRTQRPHAFILNPGSRAGAIQDLFLEYRSNCSGNRLEVNKSLRVRTQE
jgi:hypothetical protein